MHLGNSSSSKDHNNCGIIVRNLPVLATIEVGISKRFGDFHKKALHPTASSVQARVETLKAFVQRTASNGQAWVKTFKAFVKGSSGP